MIVGGSASQNNREDEDKSGCIYILVGSINIKVAYLLFVNTIHNYKLSLGHGGGGGYETMKWFPTVEEDDYTYFLLMGYTERFSIRDSGLKYRFSITFSFVVRA